MDSRARGQQIIFAESGEDLSEGDLLSVGSDGRWFKANATVTSRMPAKGLAITDVSMGSRGKILLQGLVSSSKWTWGQGSILYAGSTNGSMTATKPNGSMAQIQVVGLAFSEQYILLHIEDVSSEGFRIVSNPPQDPKYKTVTNIYVEIIEGNPKVRVEYTE